MVKRLPPLSFVRVFECSARHLNLHRAAEELGVTPGAVSQQIRKLEINLSVPLFDRLPRKLRLTTAGEQLYATSGQILRLLQDTVDRLPSPRRTVRVTVAPTLCTRWLVPRLSTFYERYPSVAVRIDASTRFVNLSDEPFDIAIRHARNGTGNPHDLLLFPDEVVAVCAPSVATLFADGEKDIGKVKLLRCDTPDHWPCWFNAKDLSRYENLKRVSFSHLMLALDAAVAGQGVTLSALKLVDDDLHHGRLVRLFGEPVATGSSYYLVARRGSSMAPHVAAFTDWIIEEAAKKE